MKTLFLVEDNQDNADLIRDLIGDFYQLQYFSDGPALLTAAVGGDRRALARLLTGIENEDPHVRELLPQIFAASRGAHLVGITGPPGAGKSTLVTALTREYRKRGRRVGIVAVDPSSPYTGGAIMGDRIRMMEHAADRNIFMRSMASRGELGGIAAATWLVAAALDAAGYDPVLVETVGAGQAELEVARLAETTLVVEVPEMGDEIQAIKAGLLEVADVVTVNKADRPGAERSENEQPERDDGQLAENVTPVERQEQTGQTQRQRSDRERGGDALHDAEPSVGPGRCSETLHEGVTGKEQTEDGARHRAGERTREQRQHEGRDQQDKTAEDALAGLRHRRPPSLADAGEVVRGT